MVRRLTIYRDYKRNIVTEVRYLFDHRKDNLRLRRRFPFEYRTVEYFNKSSKPFQTQTYWPHWKEIEEIDRQKRVIKFYPLRHDDGLIERIDIVNSKIIEKFHNRDDNLLYRSVKFTKTAEQNSLDQHEFKYLFDTFSQDPKVYIVKMSLKYACNKTEPPNEQIQRMIIDLPMNKIEIFYHMNEGDIAPIHCVYLRSLVSGFGAPSENQEKKDVNPEELLKHQKNS